MQMTQRGARAEMGFVTGNSGDSMLHGHIPHQKGQEDGMNIVSVA
jgi:hypothetical protein